MNSDKDLQSGPNKDQMTSILIFLTELKTEFRLTLDSLKKEITSLKENETEVRNLRELVNTHSRKLDDIAKNKESTNKRVWDFVLKHGISILILGYLLFGQFIGIPS